MGGMGISVDLGLEGVLGMTLITGMGIYKFDMSQEKTRRLKLTILPYLMSLFVAVGCRVAVEQAALHHTFGFFVVDTSSEWLPAGCLDVVPSLFFFFNQLWHHEE